MLTILAMATTVLAVYALLGARRAARQARSALVTLAELVELVEVLSRDGDGPRPAVVDSDRAEPVASLVPPPPPPPAQAATPRGSGRDRILRLYQAGTPTPEICRAAGVSRREVALALAIADKTPEVMT